MAHTTGIGFRFFFAISLFAAVQGKTHDLSYDSSATTECLAKPWEPLYRGGILKNPEFEDGVSGWSLFGHCVVEGRVSKNGHNRYIVARNRTGPIDSFAQKVMITQGNFYCFSGWVQISEGEELVSVVFRNRAGEFIRSGSTVARHGCWSMIKGGISANYTGIIDLLFETKNPGVEIWADNVSLQPFTKDQWRSHQNQRINKARKSHLKFQVLTGANNTQLHGATLSISSIRPSFPFGCGLNYHILDTPQYRHWFTARFPVTAFTNAMKWYSNEQQQGHQNYTISDGMIKFSKKHNISIRGHNIFWEDPKYQPEWVPQLSPKQLQRAADTRIKSVVTRYAGELIHWDCMNENLHFQFFEDKLGENASAMYFSLAHKLDPKPIVFINEYNTIEWSDDEMVWPVKYIEKIRKIQSFPGNEEVPIGIGLQGHFGSGQPNLAYMRAAIDVLATTGRTIWLTEVSAGNDTDLGRQAEYLEEVLREGYSHPAVEGMIMFAGPAAAGFNETTLVDHSFKNTAAGDVVDKLIGEWRSNVVEATTDRHGVLQTSLFNGEYEVTVRHPRYANNYVSSRIQVHKDEEMTFRL